MSDALFIFNAAAECDGCGGEVEIWTDGIKAYALTSGRFEGDVDGYERGGTLVTVHCGRLDEVNDEPCHGRAIFNLADTSWIVNDEKTLEILAGAPEVIVL